MMSSENRQTAYMTGGYSPYVPQQSQLPAQCTTNNGYLYYAPQSVESSDTPVREYEVEGAVEYRDESIDVHSSKDAVCGYSRAAAFPPEMLACAYSTTPLTCSSAAPDSNFLLGPSMQSYPNAPMMQEHEVGLPMLTTPFSDFNTHPPDRHNIWYNSNGSVSGRREVFNTRSAHGSYEHQSDRAQHGMPTYNPMNPQHH